MHTFTLILALVVAGAPGSSVRPGSETRHSHTLLSSSRDTAANGRTLSSFVATFPGTTSAINWTQAVAGVDGIGQGNGAFRIAVLVDEVEACRLEVACDADAGDYVATCTPVNFTVGQDLDVRVTSMPCLSAPSGFHTTDLVQR